MAADARFIPAHPISEVTPAAYNPRRIDPPQFADLQRSLREVGFVKPIILNTDGTIVAGHQRVRAAGSIGLLTVPAIQLGVTLPTGVEAKFNLAHNKLETERGGRMSGPLPVEGWGEVAASQIPITKGGSARTMSEGCRLATLYGNWGSTLLGPDGEILDNGDYAEVMRLLCRPCRVHVLPAATVPAAREALARSYGVYDFTRVKQEPASVSFAQLYRNRKGGRHNNSALYTYSIEPSLPRGLRIFDFGAGQADHAKALKAGGHDIRWYEPYARVGGQSAVDTTEIRRRLETLRGDIDRGGLFDLVICDHVLNSVLAWDMQWHVVGAVAMFTAATGEAQLSWRGMEGDLDASRKTVATYHNRKNGPAMEQTMFYIEDERVEGAFAFVKVHRGHFRRQFMASEARMRSLCERFFEDVTVKRLLGKTGLGPDQHAICRRPRPQTEAGVREHLEVELNMEYPGGLKLNVHEPVIQAVLARHRAEGRL